MVNVDFKFIRKWGSGVSLKKQQGLDFFVFIGVVMPMSF
ncbi:hypothetical protein [Acinetobacter bereziniae]|nr:hypothetical protein [Acinetobacter bereziniae]